MKLIHGDCIQVMDELIAEGVEVDAIITDPPYPDYYIEDFKYYDGIIDKLLEFNCRQFIFWSAKAQFFLDYTAIHIWDKITGAANQYDFIYERNGHKRQKVFRGHRINSTVSAQFAKEIFTMHKSQKPINVMKDLIKYSEADIILDPFMGSGTTGVACKQLGRDFIGIELDEKYFNIAKNRIENIPKRLF